MSEDRRKHYHERYWERILSLPKKPEHDRTKTRVQNAAARYRFYVARIHLVSKEDRLNIVHEYTDEAKAVAEVKGCGEVFAISFLLDWQKTEWEDYIGEFESFYPYPYMKLEDMKQAVDGFLKRFE